MSLIRDAPMGQIIRWITKNRVLQYPEERPDFVLPDTYKNLDSLPIKDSTPASESEQDDVAQPTTQEEIEKPAEHSDDEAADAEQEHDLEKAVTRQSQSGSSIAPVRTKEGHILVDWYDAEDPENPQNWTTGRKALMIFTLCIYTTSVYLSSSIVTPALPYIVEEFGVSETQVELLLAMYVLMYGWGSLPAASLSEIPSIGRNPPYMVTFGLFVVISIALPLVNNYPGMVVLRTLQGLFGAPCLATGGASLADVLSMQVLPKGILLWAVAATVGPSVGPLIASYSVTAENYHWAFWEILWLAGPVFIFMLFFLPETFAPNILKRKAERLRKLTGNNQFKAQSEIDQANTSARQTAVTALVRPFVVNALDPVVAFVTFYTATIYGTYYMFFTSFPLVFGGYYGMDAGSQGLTFLSIAVAVAVAALIYWAYLDYYVAPRAAKFGPGEPEDRLTLGVICAFFLPVGLFMFAWTSRPSIPWIVPLVGIFIFGVGIFIVIQLLFSYVSMIYDYRYLASVFSSNNAARSSLAFAAVLFSTPMYAGIGVDGGVSLVAGLTVLCCVGMILLRVYGKAMRARSRFTAKYD